MKGVGGLADDRILPTSTLDPITPWADSDSETFVGDVPETVDLEAPLC
jgi:hypothetical protein